MITVGKSMCFHRRRQVEPEVAYLTKSRNKTNKTNTPYRAFHLFFKNHHRAALKIRSKPIVHLRSTYYKRVPSCHKSSPQQGIVSTMNNFVLRIKKHIGPLQNNPKYRLTNGKWFYSILYKNTEIYEPLQLNAGPPSVYIGIVYRRRRCSRLKGHSQV